MTDRLASTRMPPQAWLGVLLGCIVWGWLGFPGPVSAGAGSAEMAIRAQYAKADLAVGLKFLVGLRSTRTADFKIYSFENFEVGATWERPETYFSTATRLDQTTSVLACRVRDSRHVLCSVRQEVHVVLIHREKSLLPERKVLETQSQDDWVQTSRGWLETASHVTAHRVDNVGFK